jgi:hypothetical protein
VTWSTAAETLVLGNVTSACCDFNLNGRMAEVAFWNRVLSGAELTDRGSGKLASCLTTGGGPVNYWPLTDSTTLTDLGTGGENLTNNNVTTAADHPSTTGCGGGTTRGRITTLGAGG